MRVKPIVRLVTLITSKPAFFRFLVHVSMFTISQADDGASFSSFPPMAQQFLCTVHCFSLSRQKSQKSILCRQVLNEFQREHAARQQHAFSLSTRFFFPRRHFACALSRQGRLLFWLISVFLLFFQNKSQGRHNITTYPKKSTTVSTMVHKPTTAVTKRRSKRSEDE